MINKITDVTLKYLKSQIDNGNSIFLNITEIKFDEKQYTRLSFNHSKIQDYESCLSRVPPVVINQNTFIVNGVHRWKAYLNKKQQEIPAIRIELPDEYVGIAGQILDANSSLPHSNKEKMRTVLNKFDGTPEMDKYLMEELSIAESTYYEWTADIRKQKKEILYESILNQYLKCEWSQVKIAEEHKVHRNTINNLINDICTIIPRLENLCIASEINRVKDDLKKICEERHLSFVYEQFKDFTPKDYNIWDFTKGTNEVKYPGNLPSQIIENLFYYYTKPFDVIFDPFGGGGTTIDVCKKWYRRYWVSDIDPLPARENEIKKWDITQGMPELPIRPDLILLDPPYWSQKKGQYSEHPTNLANMDLSDYYAAIAKIIKEAYKVLKKDGHIAFIIGPSQVKKQIYDHAFQVYKMLEAQFEFVNRINVPYTTQQVTGAQMTQAREGKYMLKLYRDLLVFQKTNGK